MALLSLSLLTLPACDPGVLDGHDEMGDDDLLPYSWGKPAGSKIKVATYNMHGPGYAGLSAAKQRARLDAFAAVLVGTGASVIVLQEVEVGRPQSRYVSMAEEVRRRLQHTTGRTWYAWYHKGCTPFDGGTGGQAILSTARIHGPRSIHLSGGAPGSRCDNYTPCRPKRNPSLPWIPRQAVMATTHGMTVVGVHLTAGSCSTARHIRAQEVAKLKKSIPWSEQVVLAGDVNDKDDFVAAYLKEFRNSSRRVKTSKANSTSYKIDHVLTWGGAVGNEASARASGTGYSSDHLAISAEVERARKPFRAYDSRGKRPGDGAVRCTQVAGRGGIPGTARAVAVNLTAVSPSAKGWAVAYARGAARPPTSSLNYSPGGHTATASMVKVGTGGQICVYLSRSTDIIVDVMGHFTSTGDFTALTPYRAKSTVGGRMPGNGSRTCVKVAGTHGIPTGAKAVAVNVALVNSTAGGWAVAHGKGRSPNGTSTLNYAGGVTTSNGALVNIGSGGEICVYISRAAHVIVDVTGYLGPNSNYSPLDEPFRRFDSRPGTQPRAGGTYCYPVAGRNDIPAQARMVALNLATVGPRASGYATVFPYGDGRPGTSSVNYRSGTARANLVMVRPGAGGKVCLYLSQSTDFIIDVVGYSM